VRAARFNGAADPVIDTTHPREVLEASPTDRFRSHRGGAMEALMRTPSRTPSADTISGR
jgi:hypothetical protein